MTQAGEVASHAYIIASPSFAERDALAIQLAASMLCEREGDRPCGVCRHCRKVIAGVHPDVIVIEREADDKGGKKREIYVGRIRAIISDAQVMPNEASTKVYLIKDADFMNIAAQNAMLKLLEDPPKSASFILCVKNPANLLQTVRSRCVLLRRNAKGAEDEEAVGFAREYLSLAASGDRASVLRWCVNKESMEPARTEAFIRAGREELADILCGRSNIGLSNRRCAELDELFSRCESYLRLNTGTRQIFGLLAVNGIGGK